MHVCDRRGCDRFATHHVGVKLPVPPGIDWPTPFHPIYTAIVVCGGCRSSIPVAEVLTAELQMVILGLYEEARWPMPPDWRRGRVMFTKLGAPQVPRIILQKLGYLDAPPPDQVRLVH